MEFSPAYKCETVLKNPSYDAPPCTLFTAACRTDAALSRLGASPGFTTALCAVLMDTNAPAAARQYAGVILRRQVVQYWDVLEEEKEDLEGYVVCEVEGQETSEEHAKFLAEQEAIENMQIQIPDEDKAVLRRLLPQLLASEQMHVRNTVALILATIGEAESDNVWPTFQDELLNELSSCTNPYMAMGVIRCMQHYVEEIVDDRLHTIIPSVLSHTIMLFSDEYRQAVSVPAETLAQIIRVLHTALVNLRTYAEGERRFEARYFPLFLKQMNGLLEIVNQILSAPIPDFNEPDVLENVTQDTLLFELRGEVVALMKSMVAYFPKGMSAHSATLLQIALDSLVQLAPVYLHCAIWKHSYAGMLSLDADTTSPVYGLSHFITGLLELVDVYAANPKTTGKPIRPRLEELFKVLLALVQYSDDYAQLVITDLHEFISHEEEVFLSSDFNGGGDDEFVGQGGSDSALSTAVVRSEAISAIEMLLDRWPVSAPGAAIRAAADALEKSEAMREGKYGEALADWWKYREAATLLVGHVLNDMKKFSQQEHLSLNEIPAVFLVPALSLAQATGNEDETIVLLQCRGAWLARPVAQCFLNAAQGAEKKHNAAVYEACMKVIASIGSDLYNCMNPETARPVLRVAALSAIRYVCVQAPETIAEYYGSIVSRAVSLATATQYVTTQTAGWILSVTNFILAPLTQELKGNGRKELFKYGIGMGLVSDAPNMGPLEVSISVEIPEIVNALITYWRQHEENDLVSVDVRELLVGLARVPSCFPQLVEGLVEPMVEVLESHESVTARRFAQSTLMRLIRMAFPSLDVLSHQELMSQFPVELIVTRATHALLGEAIRSIEQGAFAGAFAAASFFATSLALFGQYHADQLINDAVELAQACLSNVSYEGHAVRVSRLLSQIFMRHDRLSSEQFSTLLELLVRRICGVESDALRFPLLHALARLISKFPVETVQALQEVGEFEVEVTVGRKTKKKKGGSRVLLKKHEMRVIAPFPYIISKMANQLELELTPYDRRIFGAACGQLLAHEGIAESLLQIPVRGYEIVKERKRPGVRTRRQQQLAGEEIEYTQMSAATRFISFLARITREAFAKAQLARAEAEESELENEDDEEDLDSEAEEREEAALLRQMGVEVVETAPEAGETDEADDAELAIEREAQRGILRQVLGSRKASDNPFVALEELSSAIDQHDDILGYGDDLDDDDDDDIDIDVEGAQDGLPFDTNDDKSHVCGPEASYDPDLAQPFAEVLARIWTDIPHATIQAAAQALNQQDQENLTEVLAVLSRQ